MGPTSQGPTTSSNLAVEHYLGSCLISATARKHPAKHEYHHQQQIHHPQQHHPQQHHAQPPPPYNGWTGMPLISMAAAGRRTGKESVQAARSPLSRLAIHTQGAPLILAGHYGRNKGPQMGHKGPQVPLRLIVPKHHPSGPILTPLVSRKEPPKTPGSPPVSDNVSVASDESSGHSENSLPRIIKPRKRRKKERKPSNSSSGGTPDTETPPGQPTSIVTLQPYVPLCYEFDKFKQRAKKPDKVVPLCPADVRPELDEELHPSLCQCSLCDPAGLILDVERLCHSPTLLSPPLYRVSSMPPIGWRREELFRTTSEPVAAAKPTEYCVQHELEVTSEIVTSLNGHRDIEIRFFVPSSGWKPPAREE